MSKSFGLKHHDNAANLIRRANQQIARSPIYKQNFHSLRVTFLKTENQVRP